MLHSVSEFVETPVMLKSVEALEAERRLVRYCAEVRSRMEGYSIKINRSSDGWLSLTVCEREAG